VRGTLKPSLWLALLACSLYSAEDAHHATVRVRPDGVHCQIQRQEMSCDQAGRFLWESLHVPTSELIGIFVEGTPPTASPTCGRC
jgi:hypothetical protein